MPSTCTSTTEGFASKATASVRTVFRCVASRDRKKETLAKKKQPSSAERHPAPGFRDSGYRNATGGSGKLYYVGTYGCSWSSSIAGANAHHLYFGYSWLTPQSGNDRAYGFPLRCLQK